jgi:hypothetical protein
VYASENGVVKLQERVEENVLSFIKADGEIDFLITRRMVYVGFFSFGALRLKYCKVVGTILCPFSGVVRM